MIFVLALLTRSINIMRKLIDVLEREDLHILDRVKSFCNEVTAADPGIAGVAKTVLSIINRVVSSCLFLDYYYRCADVENVM
jgi:hypothetical protein